MTDIISVELVHHVPSVPLFNCPGLASKSCLNIRCPRPLHCRWCELCVCYNFTSTLSFANYLHTYVRTCSGVYSCVTLRQFVRLWSRRLLYFVLSLWQFSEVSFRKSAPLSRTCGHSYTGARLLNISKTITDSGSCTYLVFVHGRQPSLVGIQLTVVSLMDVGICTVLITFYCAVNTLIAVDIERINYKNTRGFNIWRKQGRSVGPSQQPSVGSALTG